MKKRRLAFVDIETSGLDPFKQEVLEVGIVLAEQTEDDEDLFGRHTLKKVGEHEIKLKPEHIETAEPKALEICRYHSRDWTSAVSQMEGLSKAADILRNSIFVAQNMSFDWTFLAYAAHVHGVDLDRAVHYHKLDLASMAFGKHYHDDNLFKFTLREMAEHFGVRNENAHTALSDARVAFEIAQKLVNVK
jgi:DNA polymerase III subunit epsilon